MSHFASTADRERAFRSVYTEVYPDLLRFVQRRTAPDQAEDVVAEVFLVVWRRLEDLPRLAGETRAWIFGVARNVLLNAHRSARRRDALGIRLADPTLQPPPEAGTDGVISRVDLTQAWRDARSRGKDHYAMKTRDIDTALRALDPADRHIDPAGPRARADLRAILATDTAHAPASAPAAPVSTSCTTRPQRRAPRRVALIGALAAAAAAAAVVLPHLADRGPTTPGQGPVTVEESAFWDAHRGSALEVDPPQSLQDLVNKAEVIVVGPIEKVSSGPVDIHHLPEGDVVNESTVLTIRTDRTLKGQADETIQVWMSGPAQGPTATKILGTESTTWFLEPSDVQGLAIMVSELGVVGPNDQGRVVTLRSPVESPMIVDRAVASDLERFIDQVAALANP